MNSSAGGRDFGSGEVWKHVMAQAMPMALAQLVHLLYNVVDRVYLGHLADAGSMALTGVGLTFPIITLIMSFMALFGNGGAALFAIARGAGKEERAGRLLGHSFCLLIICGLTIMAVCYIFKRPILFAFGASEESFVYADAYLKIYLLGTVFSMLGNGLNGFINGQGFPKIGMMTTVIGAVINLILDPIFIFFFHMGVSGAAVATVISQLTACVWAVRFLTSDKVSIKIQRKFLHLKKQMVAEITAIGFAGFTAQATNCLVQIVCNRMLSIWGGDLYIGVMTVINSVREVLSLAVMGIANGSQPVLGFNYGAGKNERVKAGIRFTSMLGMVYTAIVWIFVLVFPVQLMKIFTADMSMINTGVPVIKIYFFGFVFMALQFAGQSVFQALGFAKRAVFFSLLRKVIIVVPLTILLPMLGFGIKGVFMAEPISNIIGGTASFSTMWMTVYRKLKDTE